MSDPDLHTLTGAYAADALDTIERAQFEHHLQECPACRQEVAELRATTARLAAGTYEAPPAGLRDRVLAEVARTRQVAPRTDQPRVGSPRWWTSPAAMAAAFFLVAALGLGVLAGVQFQRADRAEQRADRIAAAVTDPERVEANAAATTGGSGMVVAADDLVVFRTDGLPELPADQAYQLWLISGDEATSAGVLGREGDLEAVVDGIGDAESVGLTVEPEAGSKQPTGDLVLQLSLSA